MSLNLKFSNNPQSLSWTANDLKPTPGQDVKVSSLQGYSSSSVAGKTINQIEIQSSNGGPFTVQIKAPGAGKNDKQVKTNGNNVANYPEAINIADLTVQVTKDA